MKNEIIGRYPACARFQEVLEQVRAGKMPEDKDNLLREGREMRQAADSRELWLRLPFSMMCETQFGNKEGYQEIIREFDRIKDRDYDRMMKGACAKDAQDSQELAWFLAACVDTLEFTSVEIYEHYRYLADLIRSIVGTLAAEWQKDGGMEGIGPETAEIYGEAVLKGCDRKVLLREKYEGFGKALLEHCRGGSMEGEQPVAGKAAE